MELQRATKEGVLELDRISAKIGSTVNAVWGTNDYTNPEKQKLAGLSNYDDSTLRQYITSLEEQNKLLQEQVEALQARVNNKGWILLE